jgi:hypothetical protein
MNLIIPSLERLEITFSFNLEPVVLIVGAFPFGAYECPLNCYEWNPA